MTCFSLSHLIHALNGGALTSVELTERCLGRIAECCSEQFVYLDAVGAMDAARASDQRRAEGVCLGPLDGIPFAAEDRFCTEKMPTENHCRILCGYRPPYDADVIGRLCGMGAILIGKLKTDGFLSGRVIKNEDRNGLVGETGALPFALMVETGGSLLNRGWDGAVAFAAGSVSRFGVISCAPSFDRVGVLASSFEDCAFLYDILAPVDEKNSVGEAKRAARIAVWGECPSVDVADAVLSSVDAPDCATLMRAWRILSAVETASEMGMYDGIRFGADGMKTMDAHTHSAAVRGRLFSGEEQKLALLGTALLTEEYRRSCYFSARGVREAFVHDVRNIFDEFDVLICRLSKQTAFLPGLADLAAVSANGLLWMAPRGRELTLLETLKQRSIEGSVS